MKLPEMKRVEAVTLQKKFKCVLCDVEVDIYVPAEQAYLVAASTPGYCAACLKWKIIEQNSVGTSAYAH